MTATSRLHSGGMQSTRTQLPLPPVLSFLSFLDILFATIGVFVVVLSVQLLAVKEPAQVSADALVVLRAHDDHLWYQGLGPPKTVPGQDLRQILDRASELSSSLQRPVRLVVAFAYEAAHRSADLEELAKSRWLRQKSAGSDSISGAARQAAAPWIRFAWRPLESHDADGGGLAARIFGSQIEPSR